MSSRIVRRTRVVAIASAVVALGLIAVPSAAGAYGGEQGALRIHGPGSVFAGSAALVSQVVSAPGSTGTFALQVKNTGIATAQYNLQVALTDSLCIDVCSAPADTVSAGSLVVTPLAHGANGYFTAPIAPGKTAAFTLKVVTPKAPNSVPGDTWGYGVSLKDTAGTDLDYSLVYVSNKVATGTTGADMYLSASGTAATTSSPAGTAVVTAPTLAVGATATFTLKLKNDSPTTEPINLVMDSILTCGSKFTYKIKAGATDVTAAVLNDTYATSPLVHGASVTLTVTVKYLESAVSCLITSNGFSTVLLGAAAYNTSTSINMYLAVNLVAEN